LTEDLIEFGANAESGAQYLWNLVEEAMAKKITLGMLLTNTIFPRRKSRI
jgi:hypothetical protein